MSSAGSLRRRRNDVVVLGEILIDFIAISPSKPEEVEGFLKKPGGAPANFSVALSRLGVPTLLISKLGNDAFGKFLLNVLRNEGVDVSAISLCPQRTGLAFVFLEESGERSFLFYRENSADFAITERDIKRKFFTGAKFFHTGTAPLARPHCERALFKAVSIARDLGLRVSLDPNFRKDCPVKRKSMDRLLRMSDVIMLTEDEAKILTGRRNLDRALDDLLKHAELVALKMGEKGCKMATEDRVVEIPAFKVTPVDTTGAGDGYDAGVIYGLLHGWDLERIGRFANAIGALVTTKKGAMTALPTLEEVERFIRSNA